MIARQSPRVNLDAGFDTRSKSEPRMNHFSKPTDLIGQRKGWGAAAEMKLGNFAIRIEQRLGQIHLALEIFYIVPALFLVGRDNRIAATEPAKRLAKRQVKIKGEIA